MGHLLAEGQAKAKIEASSQNTASMTFGKKETLCKQKLSQGLGWVTQHSRPTMTTRISWVKASASQSSRDRPSRCQGVIVCHLCSSPSVRSADPRAGPSSLSDLPGSWDLRKMSIMQECLATVCLMCAHKSWKWPGRGVSLQFLHASPYYKGHPPQPERREMLDGRNLCTGN